jgi:hypothetical protein
MKKILIIMVLFFVSIAQAQAGVTCSGVIAEADNYASGETLFILLNNSNHYIGLPTKMSAALALSAYMTGKPVTFYMSESTITTCTGGSANNSWENGALVSGWFHINQ